MDLHRALLGIAMASFALGLVITFIIRLTNKEPKAMKGISYALLAIGIAAMLIGIFLVK